MKQKIITFHVAGTHCNACKILIEDIITEQAGVKKATVNLSKETLIVEGDLSNLEGLANDWTKLLSSYKYSISLEKKNKPKQKKNLIYGLIFSLLILVLFFLLQKSGWLNLGFEGELTVWTALFIGIIASLSTCLAVVGGLVLSLSANVSNEIKSNRPFVFFHLGRLIAFAIFGGFLGTIGSALAINGKIAAILGIITALIMIILGVNLLDMFHPFKRLQLILPQNLFKRFTKIENGFFAPFIIGAATFFIPCGFTQSMQFAALSSGSFGEGAMIMSLFAIGTFPMLALLSFGTFKFAHTRFAPIFYKTAGFVVIGLGLFAFLGGLAGLGIINPLFNI